MTHKPSPLAPPPPEIVDQALALLVKAMERGQPGDETDDRESKVTRLDRLAWCHQVAGNALQMAAQKRGTLLRRQRNALIPINQLPSELLSAILIEDVKHDWSLYRLQRLAQVARQWWQTIKSDPQFWTLITSPMKVAELQIRKAGILPLRLHWANDADTYRRNDEDETDDEDDEDPTDWDALGNLVQCHPTRWTGIELEHFGGDEACFEAWCTSHFPHLKYLRVHLSDRPYRMSGNSRLNLAQCQNLQELHLPIMPYIPATPSSNSPIPLRTLHLQLRFVDSCSSHDLESVLRLTPQLVELKVENLVGDTNPPAPFDAPIIDLPNLGSLKFTHAVTGHQREWIPLLAQIRAPQLENLELHYQSEDFNTRLRIRSEINVRTAFTVLATWPSASTNRPEDAPLYAFVRNAGPSAAWTVSIRGLGITVRVGDRGSRRQLQIKLDGQSSSNKQYVGDILTHLAPFGLPVELHVGFQDETEPEFWDGVLDATPSLRTFRVGTTVEIGRQVANSLSTKAPSASSAGPRAPHLEDLSFEGPSLQPWLEDDVDGAVKTMLDKRREMFIQGRVIDPPKLVVKGQQWYW